MTGMALEGGFAAPPVQAARAIRAAFEAMALPGRLHKIAGSAPRAPLSTIDRFLGGEPARPDGSATPTVELSALSARGARLTRPGLRGEAPPSSPEVAAFRANAARLPLGLDYF